jgi:hypothetical protein
LPAIVFRSVGAVGVYRGWLGEISRASHLGADVPHPILISLARDAAYLGNGHPYRAALILNAGRAAWAGIVILAWAASCKRDPKAEDPFGLLTDVSVLVLAFVAPGPYLEPYHPVAFVISVALLAAAMRDQTRTMRQRWTACAFLLAVVLIAATPTKFEVRGIAINIRLLVGSVGVILLAWPRAAQCDTTNVKTFTPSLSAS